jgi:Zn-dependent protease with chaperone function
VIGQRTCPECSAEIPVEEGLRAWCERCNWNLGGETAPADEGFLARQYIRMGERYGSAVLERLKATLAEDLRPRWTIAKALAFSIAASVHLLSLALLVLGVFLIPTGLPQIGPTLLGIGACGFAWLLRPKPGKEPAEDVVSQERFPALHAFVNNVARELGGKPISAIVVNETFNAAYGVVGWRRIPVLWIGLPLWMALGPQERVALLGHEVAHGVNGDGTRGFVIGSALRALDEWIVFLRGPLHHAATWGEILGGCAVWILSIPFAALQSVLAHLLWLDKQRAEYFADYLGSTVSGTSAAVSLLQRTGCNEHLDDVLLRSAYSTSQSGSEILRLFRDRVANLPDREWRRLARSSQREGARLDASHPPTAYRCSFLQAHIVDKPRLVATEAAMRSIDAELDTLQETVGKRLIIRYARD